MRLESQRLPFQRLEICPKTLTDRGCLQPDLVLWINRDSQLAGSMILLPDTVEQRVLDEGVALAKSLGLGHFTTWAARDVAIWEINSDEADLLESLPLPPANRITAEDFQRALDELLERLKIITVTSAPALAKRSAYYFANLCLRNLQDLTPGLAVSTRLAAGQTASDEWVELAPEEKGWMSLWRILFLLWHQRLPPGLQPERLDNALRYALSDLTAEAQLACLDILDSEPPLHEEEAIRLHHLAGRLRQLGWPEDNGQAQELVKLLLQEVSDRFGLARTELPWVTETTELWVNCQPLQFDTNCSLVAPRAFIAGWIFKNTLSSSPRQHAYAENLTGLSAGHHLTSTVAVLKGTQKLSRKVHEAQLLHMRQGWPNRRFELPRETPEWAWDTLYLAGLISTDITLTLPDDWHNAAGIATLWDLLAERYQLRELLVSANGEQSLRFTSRAGQLLPLKVHRHKNIIEIPAELLDTQRPGTTQIWLKAGEELVKLVAEKMTIGVKNSYPDSKEQLDWGVFLYLQTQLGQYLWELCSDHQLLPKPEEAAAAATSRGLPIPSPEVLAELSLLGVPERQAPPEQALLEREFTAAFGFVPELPESAVPMPTCRLKTRRRQNVPFEQIAAKVFCDGLPDFPEHYTMHLYRPALVHYDLPGTLEIVEEFFDRISLQTADKMQTIVVSGKIVAEALCLASYSGKKRIALPQDEQTLAAAVREYRADLERLWDALTRECRRFEPHRSASSKLARRIWKEHRLPHQFIKTN